MAVGATFSALEVVPLVVLGYEAWENWRLKSRAPWMENIRWPLTFFVAVAFWNMLGAGVLGFMINPPIALYYIQGLNTTPTHAHAALFGVYGFLALGFALLILRYIRPRIVFDERLMKVGFWWLNIGLVLMLFTSLLPVGIIQFVASASEGLWYARSEAFMQSDILQTLRWVRTIGGLYYWGPCSDMAGGQGSVLPGSGAGLPRRNKVAEDSVPAREGRSAQPQPRSAVMTIAEPMTQASNEELIEHILTRYHDTHREQLPDLIQLSERVERVHGGHTACPSGLSAHLRHMAGELETHMAKEEQILFPMIARGMGAMAGGPVSVMRNEHDDHGSALEELERLTNGLTLPEGACGSWQRLYHGLATFRDDLKAHIQTENNLLFSRIDGGT